MKKKIENMTIKEAEAEVELNEEKREDLFKQKEPIDRNLLRLSKRNEKLQDQVAKIRMTAKKTDWAWLLHSNHQEHSMEKYHLREIKLRELDLRSHGIFADIEQVQIEISLIKNDKKSLPDTMKGLKKILKYIKPVEGFKRIDINEYNLSAGGIYELLIDDDKDVYNIQLTRYHRSEIVKEFNNLKEALVEIQDNYYYTNAKRDDREDHNSDYDY
jgi:hypothetical protein